MIGNIDTDPKRTASRGELVLTSNWGLALRHCVIARPGPASGKLFAATTDGHLHWREPYGYDLPWHRFGHAQEVVGMAAIGDLLFVATRDGKLWRRAV